jgi:hypothetical protein
MKGVREGRRSTFLVDVDVHGGFCGWRLSGAHFVSLLEGACFPSLLWITKRTMRMKDAGPGIVVRVSAPAW